MSRLPFRLAVVAAIACLASVVGAFTADHTASAAVEADAEPVDDLSPAQAIVLGAVEGITEYLPVSSTGHLVVAERLMDLGGDSGTEARNALDAYTVIIQFGAILAVVALYRRRVLGLVNGALGRDAEGRSLLINLLAAFAPAAVLGLALGDTIDEHLLSPGPVAGALIVGGVAILVLGPWLRERRGDAAGLALEALTPRAALVIGLMQALALWPGTSRSLVTILGGLVIGLSIAAAVEFSFLLGLLTLTAATGLAALKDGSTIIDRYGVGAPLLGIVAAGLSAFVAVRSFVNYLNKRDLQLFGWYRIAAGIGVVVLMVTTTAL